MLHDIKTVGQRCGKAKVLLHQHDGVALGLERADHFGELLHNHRGQALGDFIEQQQACAGAQDAGDGQHLLLAPRQARAGAAGALLQVGEHRVDFVDAHAWCGIGQLYTLAYSLVACNLSALPGTEMGYIVFDRPAIVDAGRSQLGFAQ